MSNVWTHRSVRFHPFTDQVDFAEGFMDALADRYYGRSRLARRFFEPCVSSCNAVVDLGPLPAWMPSRLARRLLARRALDYGIEGRITCDIETVAMVNR